MKIFVAVLTYRRAAALKVCLDSFIKHLPKDVTIGVFEDCANHDNTSELLTDGATFIRNDTQLEAEVWQHPSWIAFMGSRNVGVAGNSNRALRWFELAAAEGNADMLMLCNDDIEALGDFASGYAKALVDLKLGLLCYAPAEMGEAYLGTPVKVLAHTVRLCPEQRQTGCMMAITKELVQKIGFYDVSLGRFGQEHVDYSNRAMFAEQIMLRGKPQRSLDIVPATPWLKLQAVRSSVIGEERASMDRFANEVMQFLAANYRTEVGYRPYRLLHAFKAASYGNMGIGVKRLEELGYTLIIDHAHNDAGCTA